ncbi:MAG: hypothetical protein K1X57_05895, partial [Gemmataceae bacterium]|nr:hypothetical protein [Gemmataceae bacterium]
VATNLIPGFVSNTYNNRNVYQHDRQTGVTRMVSRRVGGNPLFDLARPQAVQSAADGSLVYFIDLDSMQYVPGDFNKSSDVYLWTRATDQIVLISKNAGEPAVTAGGTSQFPSLSHDGRWMAFASNAVNLRTPAAYSRYGDVFLKDMRTGVVTLVSHMVGDPNQPVGGANPVISGDGRYVAYTSGSDLLVPGFIDGNGPASNYKGSDVFLYDRVTGTTTLVSRAAGTTTQGGDGVSGTLTEYEDYDLDIDFTGRRVVFRSQATNLVPGFIDANGVDINGLDANDVFMFDRETGLNSLVSSRFDSSVTGGNLDSFRPIISGDGATIAFRSKARDIVAANAGTASTFRYGYDVATGTKFLISHAAGQPTVSANGSSTAATLGYDGRYVVHTHTGADLVAGVTDTGGGSDVFLYDKLTGENTLVSRSYTDPLLAVGGVLPTVSDDVRYIGFVAFAFKLIPGATSTTADVVVYDRLADSLVLASHAAGQPLVGGSHSALNPTISGDGRIITWFSSATNLAPGMTGPYDTSGTYDQVYSFDRVTGAVTLLTRSINNPTRFGNANTYFYTPAINGNGSVIAFRSSASDLILLDSNGFDDVFAYITPPPTITSMKVADGLAQRSVVRSLTVTFDQPVMFAGDPAGAFVVRRGSETVALSAAVTTGTATTVTLTFSGAGTQFGSLLDGRYSLTVLSSQVLGIEALDGDADGLAGGDYVANFHRLFGDSNGDARVDAVDFLAFRLGLGMNNPAFDYDGDGVVGPTGFLQFRVRFLKEV